MTAQNPVRRLQPGERGGRGGRRPRHAQGRRRGGLFHRGGNPPGHAAVQQPATKTSPSVSPAPSTRPCSTSSRPNTCPSSAATAPTASPTAFPGAATPTPGRSSTASSTSSAARPRRTPSNSTRSRNLALAERYWRTKSPAATASCNGRSAWCCGCRTTRAATSWPSHRRRQGPSRRGAK
jgi:hypothetical protein